jgi:hypothetical protein
MPVGETFAPVGERDVKLYYQMAITWLVQRPARTLASLDDAQEGECGELTLGVALLDTCPYGSALGGVLTEGERVQEAEAPGIGDPFQSRGGAFVLFVGRALQHRGVAREEV